MHGSRIKAYLKQQVSSSYDAGKIKAYLSKAFNMRQSDCVRVPLCVHKWFFCVLRSLGWFEKPP